MDVLSGRGRVCECGKRGLERERERKEVNATNWEIPTNWARIKGRLHEFWKLDMF